MADLNVVYRIAADITGLKDGVQRAAEATEGLGVTMGRVGSAIAGAFSVHQVVEFGRVTTQAFAEEEAALRKLETALLAQGTGTEQVRQQYINLAEEFQRTTAFSDDLVMEMQALLVQVGNVMPAQMESALKAATNLSAGLGVDLRTATLLVGKAFEGETGTLKRYGIVIDESKLKTEGASAVLEAINEKFGGQAQAQIKTYAGQMAQLNNNMSDSQETIGGVVSKGLTPMLSLFNKLPESLQVVIGGVSALSPSLDTLTLGLIAIGGPGKAIAAVTAGFSAVLPVLTTVGTAILSLGAGPLALIVAAIAAVVVAWRNWDTITGFVKGVYEGVKTWMVDKFNAIVESIKAKVDAVTGFFGSMYDKVVGHSYVPDMIAGIASEFGKLDRVMENPAKAATDRVAGLFKGMTDKIAGMVGGKDSTLGKLLTSGLGELFASGGPLMQLASAGINALLGLVSKGLGKLGGWFKGLFTGGEEGTTVNPARDQWFGGRSVDDIGDELAAVGVDRETARQMIESVFNARTKGSFDTASSDIDRLLGRFVPKFGQGGLVTQPTFAMVGDTGPELITPLSQLNRNSDQVVVQIVQDGRATAEWLVPYFPGAVHRLVGR